MHRFAESPDPIASVEFLHAAKSIMEDNNINVVMPGNVEEAMDLYVLLITTFEEYV